MAAPDVLLAVEHVSSSDQVRDWLDLEARIRLSGLVVTPPAGDIVAIAP